MKWFSHLAASIQKNHDVCLMGGAVLMPIGFRWLDPFLSVLLLLGWLALISGFTLYAKVHVRQTARVAPTEKLWFAVFACCVGALLCVSSSESFAMPALALVWPVVFAAVLVDRHYRFRMAKHRIAKRRRQQARWRASKKAVLAEWKERLRWLAGVQHDMRQPLHALGLLASHPALSAQAQSAEVVAQMITCQKWLYELAENTMEATRFELGEQREHCIEMVSSQELCDGLSSWIGHLAKTKQLTFSMDVHEGSIYTDIRRLKRVLGNLVFNAVEHTYEGGVSVAYARQGGVHRFSVSDSGPGLDSNLLKMTTEDGTFGSSDLPKTGIGLYVVKRLCREMGWNLSMENKPYGGTTFILELADRIVSKPSGRFAGDELDSVVGQMSV